MNTSFMQRPRPSIEARTPVSPGRSLGLHVRRPGEIARDPAEVEAAIGAAMRPFAAQRASLVTIPGVDAPTAATIVAEIGAGMSAFGTARRLAAWAGLCPANHEDPGKQKRRGTREGDSYLKATPVATAIPAARTRGTHPRDKLHRLRPRMGAKEAAVAIGHKIPVAVSHVLRRGAEARGVGCADLEADCLDRVDEHSTAKRPVRRLDALGCDVMLRPKDGHGLIRHGLAPLRHGSAHSKFSGQPRSSRC